MNESKPIYLSKTFWTNVIMVVALPFLPESAKAMVAQPEVLGAVFGVVNIILRLVTKQKAALW